MEQSDLLIKQTIVDIMTVLNNRQVLYNAEATVLFSKIKGAIDLTKIVHQDQIDLLVRTVLEIQRKTFNICSKLVPDIWRLFLYLQIKICQPAPLLNNNQDQINQSLINFQDIYNSVFSINQIDDNKNKACSSQEFLLFLTLWQKLFAFSDLKTLQYAVISMSLILDQQSLQFTPNNDSIQKLLGCIDKMCHFIIKFNEKIKDYDTFEGFNKILQKMQNQLHAKYEKQIIKGVKYLQEAFKLSQIINYSNIYLNTWEKLVFSNFLCASKKKKSIEDIQTTMKLLGILKRTFFLERSINSTHLNEKKRSSFSFMTSSQIQYILFTSLIHVWINFRIVYDNAIKKQTIEENKQKFSNDSQKIRDSLKEMIKILTKRSINIQMTRQLIKNLKIINIDTAITQWKQVFTIMKELLRSYPENRSIIEFTDEKSYISKSFPSSGIKYPFTIVLSVKGESIPFKQQKILIQFLDSSSKQKIIITMRNYEKSCMIFSFVKVAKNNIWGKQQKQFQWQQYEVNTIEVVLKYNKIKMFINNNDNNCLTIENSLGKVDEMVLCDREAGIGSTISQLLKFKVIEYNIFELTEKNEVNLVPFVCPKFASQSKDAMKDNLKFVKCQKVEQPSFISLMQNLGDLELFMLILFHSLKKIKTEEQLLQLIRFVLQLMQQFTIHKQVQYKQLTTEEKQARRKTIQCLGWFFAKESKSVFVIFELMRFLYIRGNRQNNEILKFLCNFSYWKEFKLDRQLVIVMKIKQLLKQAIKQEEKVANLGYCKMLMFDMILYFKQTGFKIAEKDQCLKLHQTIIQIVYEQVRDIIEIGNNVNNNRKVKLYLVEIFKLIEYVISLISCLVNRKVHEDSLDLTTTIQLTTILRDLAKLLFINKERKQITKQQLDMAMQEMLKKQEQELILPLSLNAQQACDERFSMYLGKLLSQTKSLIALIDTEMTLFEETQIKFYPIYSDTLSICTEYKIHSNIINFGIYMTMLSEKSWNYMLFAMPLAEYTEKFCQSVWRISFYELFKDKKYTAKVYKMLEHTPLPNNEYCLMKIFEAVLFCSHFQKQHLLRIIKSTNFTKSICPFKIQLMLIKYFNKLEQVALNNSSLQDNKKRKNEGTEWIQEEKLYYVLLHAENADFDNCRGVIQCLKTRKTYEKYKIIIYEIILRSLIKYTHHKQQKKRLQRQQTNYIQSDIIQLTPKKRLRLYSNDQTQLSNGGYQNESTISDVFSMNINQKPQELVKSQIIQQNALSINHELAIFVMEALEFYLDSFTMDNMQTFFSYNSTQDVSALRDNFVINVEGMMKALGSQSTNKGSFQFEKYLSFIEVYLKKYSQYLIFKTFPGFENVKGQINLISSNTDVSKKGRNKLLYKTIHIDLIKHSTQFFLEEINHRRLELHTLQHQWSQISRKHNYFWNLFVSSEKYNSLSNITTQFGERFLLKISTEKPQIDLPKMINKHSLIVSVSMFSDKIDNNDESEPSTLFDDWDQVLKTDLEQVEAKTKDKVRKGSGNIVKEIKTKKFRVLLVTNNKIYQGLLFMPQRNLLRFEENYPSDKFYDKIGAHEQQKRNDDDVEKEPMCFDVFLSADAKIYHRKYLFFDTGLEIFANEKSSFFCFDNDQKRNRFCTIYLKDFNILTNEKIKKSILQDTSKWTKGLISNYDYLIKINQHAGRSLNDLSQYYVMPWTIGEFQSNNIDRSYLMQQKHFRDLTKPLGRLFENKWKQIECRFKMSYGQYNIQSSIALGGMQPFLYGSFYSNPAIVTNYMIRIEPFSSLHYILQSEKIDLADRLFYQVSDQYLSLSRNMGDMKELIPQFYNNPEFLKNRSRINLGARQNKEIVNDVKLPKWAASAEEFMFKMRYFLQSPLVSKTLHAWIDLIFGYKAKRENALKFENLFMSEIYGPKESLLQQKRKPKGRQSQQQLKSNQEEDGSIASMQTRILFNKEFGQLPLTLFDEEHLAFEFSEDYYSFKGTAQNVFVLGNASVKDEEIKISLAQNFCLVSTLHGLELLDTGSQDYSQKETFKLVSELCLQGQITNCHMVPGEKIGSPLPYVFYINQKQNRLYSRFIKKSKFFGSLELRDEYCITQASIFRWIEDKILIVGLGNELKVYSFDECSLITPTGGSTRKPTHMKLQQSRSALPIYQFSPFSQHKVEISFIQTNSQLKLILTLDTMNKLFILKYYPHELRQLNTFELRWLRFGECVRTVLLHKLSIIVFFTSQNRLIVTNFYGELIGAKQLRFKQCIYSGNNMKKSRQLANCIVLFDGNSFSQILIGTNHGNLWKIDIFEFLKSELPIEEKQLWFEKISLNKKQQELDIKDMKIKRYGKHWQVYLVSLNKYGKKVISKVSCFTLKRF